MKIIERIVNGKLSEATRERTKEFFRKHDQEIITLEIRNTRSTNQNAYYFGVCVFMCRGAFKEMGWDFTDYQTHEKLVELRGDFEETVNSQTGEIMRFRKSTTKFTTTEFNEYLEWVWRFASETLGIVIPAPDKAKKT